MGVREQNGPQTAMGHQLDCFASCRPEIGVRGAERVEGQKRGEVLWGPSLKLEVIEK